MTYEAYRMSHQSSEQCARALYTELEATFNALLHAADVVRMAEAQEHPQSFTRDEEATIHQKWLKLEAFIAARIEA